MQIKEITTGKKDFLDLLLLADEQEDMVDRYLERGRMFVLDDGGIKAECVVTDEGGGVLEIKNIATVPKSQGKGYGKKLIEFLEEKFHNGYDALQVGTGDSPGHDLFAKGIVKFNLKNCSNLLTVSII